MGDQPELPADGGVEPRMPMAVNVAPHACRAIDVAIACRIKQVDPISPLDQQRLVFGHLGEGMPDMLPIPGLQQFQGGRHRFVCAGKAGHAGDFRGTRLWFRGLRSLS